MAETSHDVGFVEERLYHFIHVFMPRYLKDMSDEDFDHYAAAVTTKLLRKPASMEKQVEMCELFCLLS